MHLQVHAFRHSPGAKSVAAHQRTGKQHKLQSCEWQLKNTVQLKSVKQWASFMWENPDYPTVKQTHVPTVTSSEACQMICHFTAISAMNRSIKHNSNNITNTTELLQWQQNDTAHFSCSDCTFCLIKKNGEVPQGSRAYIRMSVYYWLSTNRIRLPLVGELTG